MTCLPLPTYRVEVGGCKPAWLLGLAYLAYLAYLKIGLAKSGGSNALQCRPQNRVAIAASQIESKKVGLVGKVGKSFDWRGFAPAYLVIRRRQGVGKSPHFSQRLLRNTPLRNTARFASNHPKRAASALVPAAAAPSTSC
jgi:hypothetical protein